MKSNITPVETTINNVEDLRKVLNSAYLFNTVTKIRFYEREKSYEDFTISISLKGAIIENFKIFERDGWIHVEKTAKKASIKIKFKIGCKITSFYHKGNIVRKQVRTVETFNGSKKVVKKVEKGYLAIKVDGDIFYTDGTHRYNK